MAKMRKKSDLPSKVCASCGLPFIWRKKWEKTWEEVRFCSQRCRSQKNSNAFHEKTEKLSQ
jgi:hypothetical protein